MTRINRRRPHHLTHRQQGIAIGLLLAACALIGALGLALTMSVRTGNLTSENNQNKILASTLIEQANHFKDAYTADLELKGQWDDDPVGDPTSAWYLDPVWGLSNPSKGFMETQPPPPDAFANPSNATWVYKLNESPWAFAVYLENVGNENKSDLVVATVNLKLGVCQQINQQLLGSTSIQAPSNASNTSTNWRTKGNTVDLRGASAVSGIVATCIKTTDGQYVYYSTLRVN